MIDFSKDYYKRLELDRHVSGEEIKLAYRKQVKRFHPDLHPGNVAFEAKIREINEAYDVLSNPEDRSVYDNYIDKGDAREARAKTNYKNHRTYTRTTTVEVEVRTYLKGTIHMKYRGYHVDEQAENILRETLYKLNVTQVNVAVRAANIHKQQEPPVKFKKVFDEHKPIRLHVKQPVNCNLHFGNEIEHYQLEIERLTIPDPKIIDVTKHEGESFGTIAGQFYGYVKKIEEHELVTEVTECFGETGNREERAENGTKSYRKEYFNKDCTTYWGSWIAEVLRETYVPTGETETKGNYYRAKYYRADYKSSYWGNWVYKQPIVASNQGCLSPVVSVLGIILAVLVCLLIFPNLVFILPFILFAFLLNLLPVRLGKWFASIFLWLIGGLYIFVIINAIVSHNRDKVAETVATPKPRPVESKLTPVVKKDPSNLKADTLITHTMSWDDYNGETYSGSFWVSKNAFHQANAYKNQLPIEAADERSYDEVIFSLKEYDKGHLNGIYKMFDSLRVSHNLSSAGFAELIVSFIQSVPYAIVLPNSCDSKFYQDEFITKYLASKDAKCEGNQRFGINTPVEFLGSLNGDCDTRTLLLYTVFDHYSYDVVLLSSDHYSHSILGINLPYDGLAFNFNNQRYLFWETTVPGARPGILPNEISNANYWRISLKSR